MEKDEIKEINDYSDEEKIIVDSNKEIKVDSDEEYCDKLIKLKVIKLKQKLTMIKKK